MKLKEIMDWFDRTAPLQLQESYDNSGLIIGDKEQTVNRAVVCLDVDEAVLEYAVKKGADLVISHHPCVFRPIKTFISGSPEGSVLFSAISRGIAVYSAHTNFDSAMGGLGDMICRELGLEEVRPVMPSNAAGPGHGLGRWGMYSNPIPFTGFLKALNGRLGIAAFREVGERPEKVTRVTVLNGAYDKTFLDELLDIRPDVLLTGDLKYHDALMLKHYGIYTMDAGHYQTEKIFVRGLSGMLESAFPNLEILRWEGEDVFRVVSSID